MTAMATTRDPRHVETMRRARSIRNVRDPRMHTARVRRLLYDLRAMLKRERKDTK